MGPTKSHFDRHSVDCAVIVYVKTVTKSVKNKRLLPNKKCLIHGKNDTEQKATNEHTVGQPIRTYFLNLQVWSAHCSAVAWMEKPFHVILNADKIHIHSHSHSPRILQLTTQKLCMTNETQSHLNENSSNAVMREFLFVKSQIISSPKQHEKCPVTNNVTRLCSSFRYGEIWKIVSLIHNEYVQLKIRTATSAASLSFVMVSSVCLRFSCNYCL